MQSPTRLTIAVAAAAALTLAGCAVPQSQSQSQSTTVSTSSARSAADEVAAALGDLEEQFDARVGIGLLDTGTGETVAYRDSERFGYASTVKVFAAAEFLRGTSVDERNELVRWTSSDIDRAGYSPVTTESIGTGLTSIELAEAAVRDSDNTATNLVLARIGGPAGLDDALELLGDTTTEVVNEEPDLNTVEPGSTADTTTPAAFTSALATLLESDYLTGGDRAILLDWMSGNPTGDQLVRAGAPDGWIVADKSGGAGPIRNDIAVVTPPGRAPLVVTVLTEMNDPSAEYDDALVSSAADVVLRAVE